MTDRREPRTEAGREFVFMDPFYLDDIIRIEAEAAAPREAPDQRLRDALEGVMATWHGPYGPAQSDEPCACDAHVKARVALATEGEPTAPLEWTPQEIHVRGTESLDYMCPNCVTPWKCNGPHIPEPTAPEPREYEDVERLARALRTAPTSHYFTNRVGRFNDVWWSRWAQEVADAYRAAPESREAGT